MTMMWGYHYNEGVRVGYDISFENNNGRFILHNVSSKDKGRIISEIKQAGYKRSEIDVDRVEN
jgi:hypothetical protein